MPGRRRAGSTRKTIFDPIHGPISLDGTSLELVATPEFQRLWGIRQTGFAHLVFPGANHTRLEHSLGTYWVAREMAGRVGLSERETERLAAGALLHDLGHGPFSHTLDGPMLEALGVDHEGLSRARILGTDPAGTEASPHVPDVLERAGLRPREVADLVDAHARSGRPRFLRELLHGAVDADRVDYLQRDAHYTGVAHGAVDAVRLLDTLQSVDDRVVFAEKGRSAVEGFLVGRALMYATVYYHKTVRAAESMAQAAVERLPGFPAAARDLFALTDGDLLVRLRAAGGVSADLTSALLERRLYKRAHGFRSLAGSSRERWRRLLHAPEDRRALEDRIAAEVGGHPGSVLLDLGGLEPRGDPADDWGRVGLEVDGEVEYPFRGSGPWAELATRPPADWAVTVYAEARRRDATARWFSRDRRGVP